MQSDPLLRKIATDIAVESFIMSADLSLRGYDDLTEVLTSRGWRPISSIGFGDLLCQVALENFGGQGGNGIYRIEFAYPSAVFHRAGYFGQMVKLSRDGDIGFDLLVAPNQKIVCLDASGGSTPMELTVEAISLTDQAMDTASLLDMTTIMIPRCAALPAGDKADELEGGLRFYIAAKAVAAPVAATAGTRELRLSLGLSESDQKILHHCLAADTSFFDILCREMRVPYADAGAVTVAAIDPSLLEPPAIDFAGANRWRPELILGCANLWLSQIGYAARRDESSSMMLIQDDDFRDLVSAAATMAGRGNRDLRSKLIISRKLSDYDPHSKPDLLSGCQIAGIKAEIVEYGGFLHGLTVSFGKIIVRRNGTISICGDSAT